MSSKEPIIIKQVVLHRLMMQLKHPFTTSFGTFQKKDFYIIEVNDDKGNIGFGETVAFPTPWYTEETVETTAHMIEAFLLPLVFEEAISHPSDLSDRFKKVRRNHMAKAAVEGAIWDLFAKRTNQSLAKAIGGERTTIDVGVSIGIQPTVEQLIQTIAQQIEQGYQRVKIKIKPGWDVEVVKEVRKHFPDLPLMVDANSAYTLSDVDRLKALDDYELLMIEQPLGHDDFIDHAELQRQIKTPVCLDESIHTYSDVRTAIALGSCQIINIKLGRVGGIAEAIKIHDLCKANNIPVWCGGMLEAGVGRAHSIALSTLSQFTLPGDISASNRYWEKDIIQPEVTMENGTIQVPTKPGIGYDLDWEALEHYRTQKKVIHNNS